MKCSICDKEAVDKYCEFHENAYKNIANNFEVWKRGMALTWKEYLNALLENSYTGSWVKEVVEHLIKSGEW
jgi:hypothetical protein